jgi:hypothetical protein
MKSEQRLLSEVCTETETGPDCISGMNKIQVTTDIELCCRHVTELYGYTVIQLK